MYPTCVVLLVRQGRRLSTLMLMAPNPRAHIQLIVFSQIYILRLSSLYRDVGLPVALAPLRAIVAYHVVVHWYQSSSSRAPAIMRTPSVWMCGRSRPSVQLVHALRAPAAGRWEDVTSINHDSQQDALPLASVCDPPLGGQGASGPLGLHPGLVGKLQRHTSCHIRLQS